MGVGWGTYLVVPCESNFIKTLQKTGNEARAQDTEREAGSMNSQTQPWRLC